MEVIKGEVGGLNGTLLAAEFCIYPESFGKPLRGLVIEV